MSLTAPLRGPVAHCKGARGPNARLNALAIEAVSRLVDVTPGTRDWLMCALTYADPETGELWPTCSRIRRAMPSRRTGGLVGERSPARWKKWASGAGYVQSKRLLPQRLTPEGERRRAAGLPLRPKDRSSKGTCVVTIDFARLGLAAVASRPPRLARKTSSPSSPRVETPSAAHSGAPARWTVSEAHSEVRRTVRGNAALAAAFASQASSPDAPPPTIKTSRAPTAEGLSGRLAELAASVEEKLRQQGKRGRDPP